MKNLSISLRKLIDLEPDLEQLANDDDRYRELLESELSMLADMEDQKPRVDSLTEVVRETGDRVIAVEQSVANVTDRVDGIQVVVPYFQQAAQVVLFAKGNPLNYPQTIARLTEADNALIQREAYEGLSEGQKAAALLVGYEEELQPSTDNGNNGNGNGNNVVTRERFTAELRNGDQS